MIKYIVKKTYVAKSNHPLFKEGTEFNYFIGRTINKNQYIWDCVCPYIINYAFTKKEDAEKYILSDEEYDNRYRDVFIINSEIIEVSDF